jgi:putative endonuclease
MGWSLYIIRCGDNTLYTGITTDVARRFAEHTSGYPKGAKYLRGRSPLELVYTRIVGTHSEALIEERRIKRLTRAAKMQLIENHGSSIAD